MLVTQSCPALYNPMNYNLLGFSVQGILQARILEWAAIPFSKGSSQPRDQTQVSCIAGEFFTMWATREAPEREERQAEDIKKRWQEYTEELYKKIFTTQIIMMIWSLI